MFISYPDAMEPTTTKYLSVHHAATTPSPPSREPPRFAAIHSDEHRKSVVDVAAVHEAPHFTFSGLLADSAAAISVAVCAEHFAVETVTVHVDGPHGTTELFVAVNESPAVQSEVKLYVVLIALYVTLARTPIDDATNANAANTVGPETAPAARAPPPHRRRIARLRGCSRRRALRHARSRATIEDLTDRDRRRRRRRRRATLVRLTMDRRGARAGRGVWGRSRRMCSETHTVYPYARHARRCASPWRAAVVQTLITTRQRHHAPAGCRVGRP